MMCRRDFEMLPLSYIYFEIARHYTMPGLDFLKKYPIRERLPLKRMADDQPCPIL